MHCDYRFFILLLFQSLLCNSDVPKIQFSEQNADEISFVHGFISRRKNTRSKPNASFAVILLLMISA